MKDLKFVSKSLQWVFVDNQVSSSILRLCCTYEILHRVVSPIS